MGKTKLLIAFIAFGTLVSFQKTTEAPEKEINWMTLEEAKGLLQANSLNIDAIIYDDSIRTVDDSLRAFVWKQLPEIGSGTKLRLGSSLDIWLSIDSAKILPDTLVMDSIPVNPIDL